MRVPVVLSCLMVLILFAKRRQNFQPLVDVFDQAALVIIDVNPCCDMHGGNQHHAFLHSAFSDNLLHLRCYVDVCPVSFRVKLQILGESLHRSACAIRPLSMRSATRPRSLYMTRSLSIVGHTDRIAACASCPRFEVLSGARKSSACATAIASIARTLHVFCTTRFSLMAAVIPIET